MTLGRRWGGRVQPHTKEPRETGSSEGGPCLTALRAPVSDPRRRPGRQRELFTTPRLWKRSQQPQETHTER